MDSIEKNKVKEDIEYLINLFLLNEDEFKRVYKTLNKKYKKLVDKELKKHVDVLTKI